MDRIHPASFFKVIHLIERFQRSNDPSERVMLARTLYDVYFWASWLVRGYLFEPKLHASDKAVFTSPMIPSPLSQILDVSRGFFGRLQLELPYDIYTKASAQFPEGFDPQAIDYNNPKALLAAVRRIKTQVGFNDVDGAEHYFRHCHSLMEAQMDLAFEGYAQIFSETDAQRKAGWDSIVRAANQAHQVFRTMLAGSPPDRYAEVRLPIAGTQGNLGSVYPPEGVFYQNIGIDTFERQDGQPFEGRYVKGEWGQTGANSSMYNWFDILIGVSDNHRAYATDANTIEQMRATLSGELDSTQLDPANPIRNMQAAFNLFTRPWPHRRRLVETHAQVSTQGLMDCKDKITLLGRLELATAVLRHRLVHAQYVIKAIYRQSPKGGQLRGTGTGGTPAHRFLDSFTEQTLKICREKYEQLNERQDLTQAEREAIARCLAQISNADETRSELAFLGDRLSR